MSSQAAGKRIVFVDGAYSKKINVGGWAYHTADGVDAAYSQGWQFDTTNNRMELKAIEMAMRWALIHARDNVIIVSDSQYAINTIRAHALTHNYVIGLRLLYKHCGAEFEWVKGHNGNEGNERVDRMATEAVAEGRKWLLANDPLYREAYSPATSVALAYGAEKLHI